MIKEYENKIINADCLDILKKLPDKCIDLVLTDPPYNASNKKISCKTKNFQTVNEEWDKGFVAKQFLDLIFEKISPCGSMLVFCSHHTLKQYIEWNKMKLQQIIHWQKSNPFPAIAKVYTPSVEYCLWFIKGSPYVFNKEFAKTDIVTTAICQGAERTDHPTQKPLFLFEKLLQIHSNENDLVLDCFSGSGTTAEACHRLKRRFICIEKDFDFWKASCKRLEDAQRQGSLFQNKKIKKKYKKVLTIISLYV